MKYKYLLPALPVSLAAAAALALEVGLPSGPTLETGVEAVQQIEVGAKTNDSIPQVKVNGVPVDLSANGTSTISDANSTASIKVTGDDSVSAQSTSGQDSEGDSSSVHVDVQTSSSEDARNSTTIRNRSRGGNSFSSRSTTQIRAKGEIGHILVTDE